MKPEKPTPQEVDNNEWPRAASENPASVTNNRTLAWDLVLDESEVQTGGADRIEVRDAIAELTPKNFKTLGDLGKMYSLGTTLTEKDLINEAVCRTMDGRRRWTQNTSMVVHLAGVMRSIAYGQRLKDVRELPLVGHVTEERPTQVEPTADVDLENSLAQKEAVEKIRAAFVAQPEVLAFLDLVMREEVSEAKKILGTQMFRSLRERARRELIRQFPDLESQMRSKASNSGKTRSSTLAFECPTCVGKVLRVSAGEHHRQWKCAVCGLPFGPTWIEGQPETRLVGLQVWKEKLQNPADPFEKVHVEFREERNGEDWLVWGEKWNGEWSFWERPHEELRRTRPNQWTVPRLIERAEGVLSRAMGFAESAEDDPPLADYVKCIIEKNLKRLDDEGSFAWVPS
jgi:hypothetical protein